MEQTHKMSPFPSGSYLEVDLNLIDEGKMASKLSDAIRRAFADLIHYQRETNDLKSKAGVSLQISLGSIPNIAGWADVSYKISVKIPSAVSHSNAKIAGEKLLCQPIGTGPGAPEQQVFFDANGRIIGGINPSTGEINEIHDAQIAPAALRVAR